MYFRSKKLEKFRSFNGPIISDIEDKTFKHGEKCYQYKAQSDRCDTSKKIIPFISPKEAEEINT